MDTLCTLEVNAKLEEAHESGRAELVVVDPEGKAAVVDFGQMKTSDGKYSVMRQPIGQL